MVDPRDVARIRTEARLLTLTIRGLLDTTRSEPVGLAGSTPDEALRALVTAREFAERCEVALGVALEQTPGARTG